MMYFTETINEIDRIANKIMIIFGIIMSIFGLIGNLLNICIFTKWSHTRQKSLKSVQRNNVPLYLLASSFSNLIVIIYPFLTRILFDGYKYRVTRANVFILCKLRYYALHTFDLISLTCICMAIFDRYLVSSRNVYVRDLSATKKRTIIVIFILTLIIGIHSIPLVIYYDVSKTGHCQIFSINYSYYYLYVFQISLHGLIPILFLTIFGLLTLKQLKILSEHNRYNHMNSDRQLSRMLLLISIAIILSSIPNCIEEIYDIIFDRQRHSSEFFLYHVISSILFYTIPVTSFYIYFISTPNFRAQFRNLYQTNRSNECLHPIRRCTVV